MVDWHIKIDSLSRRNYLFRVVVKVPHGTLFLMDYYFRNNPCQAVGIILISDLILAYIFLFPDLYLAVILSVQLAR